jgi:hypothetical protein
VSSAAEGPDPLRIAIRRALTAPADAPAAGPHWLDRPAVAPTAADPAVAEASTGVRRSAGRTLRRAARRVLGPTLLTTVRRDR